MAYTPPAYNVVNADLKPVGSAAVVIPAYNVVNANLAVEDGGGGGSSQTLVLGGIYEGVIGFPEFILWHTYITNVGDIPSSEYVGYHTFELREFNIFPYSIATGEQVGYPTFILKNQFFVPHSITGGEQFGYATFVLKDQFVDPYGITSNEQFGVPEFELSNKFIEPTSIASDEVFGVPEFVLLSIFLEAPIYSGENVEFDLQTYRTEFIELEFEVGEDVEFDLQTYRTEFIELEFEVGEDVEFDIEILPVFYPDPEFIDGAEAFLELATTDGLDCEFDVGECFEVALYESDPTEISVDFYSSELLEVDLSLGQSSFGSIGASTGSNLEVEIDWREQDEISGISYIGENAEFDLSLGANLGDIVFDDGIEAAFDNLENEPHTYIYVGEQVSASVYTQMTLPGEAGEGAELEIDLTIGPSEGIGTFSIIHGEEHAVQTLALLKAVILGVTFYNSYMFHVGAPYIGTFMDMDSGCCANHYPGQQDFHKIEMNDAEFGDQKFDGDRIRATVDFQTQPRFRFNFTHGETLRAVEDNTFLMSPRMNTGETLRVSLESNHINFPLCPVNFIPDGDNVYVELDYIDDATCYADYFHTGETFAVHSFQVNQNFQERYYDGARMDMELTLRDAWVIRAYTGEQARWRNPAEVEARAYTGEQARVDFYVAPIIGGTGEALEASLTTIYEVVFLEDGCLDNEYIWQDENGDPIPEKFNPVPVELDPYQHDLKAKCQ